MARFLNGKNKLDELANGAFRSIDQGIYDVGPSKTRDTISLSKAIRKSHHAPLITEIKFSSPSAGRIRGRSDAPESIARSMVRSGATALSVLTQPYFFDGSPDTLIAIRKVVSVPILMKDIVVSKVQIDAAKRCGADCVLLIKTIFDRGLAEDDFETLYSFATTMGLEVIVETSTQDEYHDALGANYELVGINNRNLDTLQIDLKTTETLIARFGKGKALVISESGIATPDQIRYLKKAGADAFLVGTSIMQSQNIADAVRLLYEAF